MEPFNKKMIMNHNHSKTQMLVTAAEFTFAITNNNEIYSWGSNNYGQLGLGHNFPEYIPQLVDFFHNQTVDNIICGQNHAYAVVKGSLYSWGSNKYGQLGLGHNIDQNLPQLVDFFRDNTVKEIFCSNDHTFAIVDNGSLYSWGKNYFGQGKIGYMCFNNYPQLVDFFGDKKVVKIVSNSNHMFAIIDNGSVYLWATNYSYLGHNICQIQPQLVDFFHGKIVHEIICDNCNAHAIVDNGSLYSWGKNYYGELGLGDNISYNRPQLVDFFGDKCVHKIIFGHNNVFAIVDNGCLYSWGGNNGFGQLGLGDNICHNRPHLVDFFRNNVVHNIVCRYHIVYAIVDDGLLYSWGKIYRDELPLNIPQLVDSLQGNHIDMIICNDDITFAVADDGTVHSWYDDQLELAESVVLGNRFDLGYRFHSGYRENKCKPQLARFCKNTKLKKRDKITKIKSAKSRQIS